MIAARSSDRASPWEGHVDGFRIAVSVSAARSDDQTPAAAVRGERQAASSAPGSHSIAPDGVQPMVYLPTRHASARHTGIRARAARSRRNSSAGS
jgi:hypothetical protein